MPWQWRTAGDYVVHYSAHLSLAKRLDESRKKHQDLGITQQLSFALLSTDMSKKSKDRLRHPES